MPRGGARNRSGPPSDPRSGRSERRGVRSVKLPAEGYTKRPPGLNQFITGPSRRHREIWNELWKTPQACAWSKERWLWPTIADLVRAMVRNEDPEAKAAFATTVRQLRDELGLSRAGLRVNGWEIAADEVGERRVDSATTGSAPRPRRLRAVKG